MTKEEIKNWYAKNCLSVIKEGWDDTEERCLDFITRDCYAMGFNKAMKTIIERCKVAAAEECSRLGFDYEIGDSVMCAIDEAFEDELKMINDEV